MNPFGISDRSTTKKALTCLQISLNSDPITLDTSVRRRLDGWYSYDLDLACMFFWSVHSIPVQESSSEGYSACLAYTSARRKGGGALQKMSAVPYAKEDRSKAEGGLKVDVEPIYHWDFGMESLMPDYLVSFLSCGNASLKCSSQASLNLYWLRMKGRITVAIDSACDLRP
ncbi:hypothetical protein VNO77_04034 [Canavalia gladiata]|uniref:Uncharacterized protein n=1 Tax=Canavalia gladiata TaxID=3824 RepID=A0AAN9RCT2_CANGL